MPWEFSVLIVANVTATSDELLETMRARVERGACRFHLVVPGTGAEARAQLETALQRMRDAGLEKVEGQVGDPDPVVAVMEKWDPKEFDEIIVSTLPTGASRWLRVDLPHRLEKLTSVTVHHVISRPRQEEAQTSPAPEHEQYGVLAPLAAALTRKPDQA